MDLKTGDKVRFSGFYRSLYPGVYTIQSITKTYGEEAVRLEEFGGWYAVWQLEKAEEEGE